MAMPKSNQRDRRYWLFKSEPEEFSIDDLASAPDGRASWTGVRNYQARNLLRDQVQVGDELFFYHSSTKLTGVAGIAVVSKAAFPDPSALKKGDPYFDPKATPANPIWCAVEVQFIRRFPDIIPLAILKITPGLENMMVCRRGARLSIQPVTPEEWQTVLSLPAAKPA